jgi:hypothetical protein
LQKTPQRYCLYCGAIPKKLMKCKNWAFCFGIKIYYCHRTCQEADWFVHKTECAARISNPLEWFHVPQTKAAKTTKPSGHQMTLSYTDIHDI